MSNKPTYEELEKKIFELEKSESELKLNFKRAQKLSLIGSWDWDPNTDKVSYTDMILEIFGLNEKNFEGDFASMLAGLVHPDDKAKVDAAAEEARATGVGSDVTYRIIRSDGEIRWIHALGESIFENGKFIKVIGTNQDVTEQKKIENKFENLSKQLQKALNEIKTLKGFISICSHCHKIKNDDGSWENLEIYISKNSDALLSHGICPDCFPKFYQKKY